MSMDRLRLLRIFAVLGALLSYATIVLGGTVRGMDAGGVCPDWPLCHGSIIPNLADARVLVEFTHRLVAAFTTLFLLLTFLVALLWFRSDRPLLALSLASVAILATQVGIGALVISSNLNWVIVTVHLALGTATFATSLVVALLSVVRRGPEAPTAASAD